MEYQSAADAFHKQVHVTVPVFVAVLAGRKVVHAPGGDDEFGAGTGFFAWPGSIVYSEMFAGGEPFRSLLFFFSTKRLAALLERRGGPCTPQNAQPVPDQRILRIPLTPLLEHAARSAHAYLEVRPPAAQEFVELKIEELLLALVHCAQGEAFLELAARNLRGAKAGLADFMREHFAKPLTVVEFARLAGRSPSTFKREFAQAFGEPPKAWINRQRLARAKALLQCGDANVTEACFASGFENPAHFSTLFKAAFGVPPVHFKRK